MRITNSDHAAEFFNTLADIPSTNDKKDMLEANPAVKVILRYAYNPFLRYYVAKFPGGVVGKGKETFTRLTWKILAGLSMRSISGDQGRQVLYGHIIKMTPTSAELLKKIVKKDLRCGINAKTINEVWPDHIPQHNILLAEDLTADKLDLPCYISPKVDGLRGTYVNGEFYTRTGKLYESLTSFKAEVEPYFRSVTHGIDGELVVPNATSFDDLSGKLRSKKDQKSVHFFIFDIVMPNHTFTERLQVLSALSISPCCTVIPHLTVYDMAGIKEYFKMCVRRGFEGVVLKTFNHYYPGKRSYDWMRLVTEHRGDGVLIDVEEGTGKNAGGAGALIVNYKGEQMRIAAGKLDYEQRKDMWKEPEVYVGSLLQFCYKGRTSKGNLRQPRFERWREDKEES